MEVGAAELRLFVGEFLLLVPGDVLVRVHGDVVEPGVTGRITVLIQDVLAQGEVMLVAELFEVVQDVLALEDAVHLGKLFRIDRGGVVVVDRHTFCAHTSGGAHELDRLIDVQRQGLPPDQITGHRLVPAVHTTDSPFDFLSLVVAEQNDVGAHGLSLCLVGVLATLRNDAKE